MNEKQEIVVAAPATTALAQFGQKEALELLANRIGMYFNIPDADTRLARPACLKAAQLTYQYGLVPGVDMFVIKRGRGYSAEPSLEMWKKMADRHAFVGKFRYTVDVEDLTPEEVAAHTDPDVPYTPEDKGARARVFRFDVAREMKELGIPYKPRWHYAFWRKNANEKDEWVNDKKTGRKFWQSDTVPAQRSRQDVAIRRATRAALMAEFPMIPLDDFESRYQSVERIAQARLALANQHIAAELEDRSKPDGEEEGQLPGTQEAYTMDEDGNVWASEPSRPSVRSAPAVAAGLSDNPDGWGDWMTVTDYSAAVQWAAASGKFAGDSHVASAWQKHLAFLVGVEPSEVLAKWRTYVNKHEAPKSKKTKGGGQDVAATASVQEEEEREETTGDVAPPSLPWQQWTGPQQAILWAAENTDMYADMDRASVAFASHVRGHGGYTKKNRDQVFESWYNIHHIEEEEEEEEEEYGEYAEV